MSDSRLFFKPCTADFDMAKVTSEFARFGHLKEVKLLQGFGFVEYTRREDASKAIEDDIVLCGERISVTFSNRSRVEHRRRENREGRGRDRDRDRDDRPPGPRRSSRSHAENDDLYSVPVSGLSQDTKWKGLKDHFKKYDINVTYTEVSRSGDGQGLVDFDTKKDYDNALNEMQGSELDGNSIEIHFDKMTRKPREKERKRERERRDPRRDRDSRRDRDRKRGRGYDERDRSPVRNSSRTRDNYRDRDENDRSDRRRERGPKNPRNRRRSNDTRDDRGSNRRGERGSSNRDNFRDRNEGDQVVDDRREFRDNDVDMAYNDDQYEYDSQDKKPRDDNDLFEEGGRGSSDRNGSAAKDSSNSGAEKKEEKDKPANQTENEGGPNGSNKASGDKKKPLTKQFMRSPSLSPRYSDDIAINEDTPPAENNDIMW